jgi:predicted phosphodiesterase
LWVLVNSKKTNKSLQGRILKEDNMMNKTYSQNCKLIQIKKAKRIIFIGDTHGDLEASQKVIGEYLREGNKIVFLGDYVDRGDFSKENLNFLLEQREKYPAQIFLLQGNHEGYPILKFSPAEFWENLTPEEFKKYSEICINLPLVLVAKNIIALHGVLPEVRKLEEINKIQPGDKNWVRICWGDFEDTEGRYLGIDFLSGRPIFGRDYFFELMERYRKRVLIRAHQPDCSQFLFDDRCLTLFTSISYKKERTIAIANLEKEIKSAKDLEVRQI